MARERLCINSNQHEGVEERAEDSEMRETPNQRVKRDAGSRQGKCPQAHLTGLYTEVACRDLNGQLEGRLKALISWEPRAHTHERPFQNLLRLLTHVRLN